MASNEEIMQKVNPDNSPSLWTDAMVSECMDAARKDEMDEFRKFLIGMNELFLASELKKLYTIFKQQNS